MPEPPWPALPNAVAWSIVRFAQQAIQNAIQHAGPATISVRLGWAVKRENELQLELVVRDNGVGFDPAAPVPAGISGLASLHQRAAWLVEFVKSKAHPARDVAFD